MSDMVTLSFEQPADRLSMNGRYHWAVRSRRTQIWRHTASIHAHKTLGAPKAARAQPPSFVRVTFPVADNRRRDADNPAPTCKAIVDGLVDAGLWPDDSPEWVETLGSRFAKGAGVVVVEIIPRTELAA
jgi:crossover junction endodeoxyribonuclease RusA